MTTTYLITGANRGIGLEMARQILKSGDHLHAVCRHPASATELKALIDASQGRGQIYKADVESATGLLQRFQSLTLANTGSFINYDGKVLAL